MKTLAPSRRQMLVGAAVVAAASTSTFQPAVASPGGATVTQIRNATLRIDYAGVRFLVDPMLADQGAFPGFPGTAMSHLRNPLVPLPTSLPELLAVDAVVVTHTHPDHWDEAAQAVVPKSLPIFVQNDSDAAIIRDQGFTDVRVLTDATAFRGMRLTKTAGQHGPDAVVRALPELLKSAAWSSAIQARRPSIWPATPCGMTPSPRPSPATGPRSSSSTPASPRSWTWALSSWDDRTSSPFTGLRPTPKSSPPIWRR